MDLGSWMDSSFSSSSASCAASYSSPLFLFRNASNARYQCVELKLGSIKSSQVKSN